MSSHSQDSIVDVNVIVGPERPALPNEPLADIIYDALRRHAEKELISQIHAESGTDLKFSELLLDAVRVAEGLHNLGLRLGHVAAVCSRHVVDLYPAVVGVVLAGLTLFPTDPASSPGELRALLSVTKPRAIFAEPRTLALVHDAIQGLPKMPKVIVLDQDEVAARLVHEGDMAYADLIKLVRTASPDIFAPPYIPRLDDHVPLILAHASYSGAGSSGPKAVMLSNCRALFALELMREALPDDEDGKGVFLSTSQISWATGMFSLLRCCWAGQTRIILESLEPLQVLAVLEKYSVRRWLTTPHALSALTSHAALPRFDLKSLQSILVTGESLSAVRHAVIKAALGSVVLQPMYCVTEAGPLLLNRDSMPGAVGKPFAGVSLKVVDVKSGASLGPGEAGELRAKSKGTFKGYVGDPEATSALFDEKGWFCTGDVMRYDNEGYFYFVERLNENIQYLGHSVSATEIENLIRKHPGVRDVAVVGRPHDEDGEHPTAFIVTETDKTVSAEEIIRLVSERFPEDKHKHLRGGVEFLECLPRTTSGKVSRRLLADRLRQPKCGLRL